MSIWLPLESNPEVMNTYIGNLGIEDLKVEFTDVFGLNEDLMSMVPRPVKAFLFVFPINEATEAQSRALTTAQEDEIKAFKEKHPELFFVKQLIANACGTIGILHALLNNKDSLGAYSPTSVFGTITNLLTNNSSTPGEEKKKDPMKSLMEVGKQLEKVHQEAAVLGVTENQSIDTPINLHFVCFVHVGDRCVELDGRQADAILHGVCEDNEAFIRCAAEAMQAKMAMNKGSYEFNITALVEK
ncbi:cysteine peptidase, Clan CA, family C12 [Angomonas deanei]|nr:ubiquitin carboxyl-terminal hydrolase L3 [Angomonas deanei]EPY39680.1 cysteine peptidase, Clan CA, family C12 [Angomonas deanei]|eukprot:EPY25086.1 ubiquitin carboxyl-terminal hydrolase L3 [Angomonas deanei]